MLAGIELLLCLLLGSQKGFGDRVVRQEAVSGHRFVQCSVRAFSMYENVHLPVQIVGLSRARVRGCVVRGPE